MNFDEIQKIRNSRNTRRKLRQIMNKEGGWEREVMLARINLESKMVPLQKYGKGPFKEYDVYFDPFSNCYVMKNVEVSAIHPPDPERDDFELDESILLDLYETEMENESVNKYAPAKETHEGKIREGFIRNPIIEESTYTLSGEKLTGPTLFIDLYISPEVYEKIASGKLPGRSLEIRKNARTGKWYIDSLALLSAEEPYFSFSDLSGPPPEQVPVFGYRREKLSERAPDSVFVYSKWPLMEKNMKEEEQEQKQVYSSDKDTWIANKIKILTDEGKPNDQAVAIAHQMWEDKLKEHAKECMEKDESLEITSESLARDEEAEVAVEGEGIEMSEAEQPEPDEEKVMLSQNEPEPVVESPEHAVEEMSILDNLTAMVSKLSEQVNMLIKKDEAVHEGLDDPEYASDMSSITANPATGPVADEPFKTYQKEEEASEETETTVNIEYDSETQHPETEEAEETSEEQPDLEEIAKQKAEEYNSKMEAEQQFEKQVELKLEEQIIKFKKANKDLPNVLADLKTDYPKYAKDYNLEAAENYAAAIYKFVTPYPTSDAVLKQDEVEMYNKNGTQIKDTVLQQYAKDFGDDAVYKANEIWNSDSEKIKEQFGSKERWFELYMKHHTMISQQK